jgi:hypothetical protein
MLNFFKTKTFKVASFVIAFAVMFTLTASAYTFSGPTLKKGMKGGEVAELQTLVGAIADGNFGPATHAKVATWQAANGLTVDGVFGKMSMAKANGGSVATGGTVALCPNGMTLASNCATAPGTTGGTTGGTLTGMYGDISNIDQLSQYSNEEVGDGEDDIKVLGFDLEASNDGDIKISSMKLTFDGTGNTGSSRLNDYVDSVSIWMGSTKVGSVDSDDFTKDSTGIYSKTIQLDNAVVKADKTASFYVAVDAVKNLDSGDISGGNDSWTVGINNVRFVDGSGVTTTDADSIPAAMDWDTAGDGVTISFVTFSAAADTELKISTATDNPDAGIVKVSDTGTTDNVVLLSGKFKLDGTADALLNEFPITFGAETSNMNVIAENVTLKIGDEEFSETVPSIAAGATASITFDNLDFDLEAGKTVNFQVIVEVADVDDFTAGASLTASVTSTNRGAMDIENEEGDQLAAGEKSGTAGGEAQEFRANGIKVELVSKDAVKSANDTNDLDTGTFTIKFKVTAIGDTVYVASVASPDGTGANAYTMDYSGTATTTDQSAVLVNTTDSDLTAGGTYMIEEGESEVFEMTVLRNGSATDGLYRVSLTNVKWDIDDDSTPDITYSTNLDTFKTSYINLD